MSFKIVIPSRWNSSRFPGKPLALINGKPMILHVVERALQTSADEVIVATDDLRIIQCVVDAGYSALQTSKDCKSGTDRVAEVAEIRQWDDKVFVVNVQGDEPLINPAHIETVYKSHLCYSGDMYTLCSRITDGHMVQSPNVVKVVTDCYFRALYFSRAPIPYDRDDIWLQSYRHIGIYGYSVGFLKIYTEFASPMIEESEQLEQLRALWYGYRIRCDLVADDAVHGVDTPEDLKKVQELVK